MYMNAAQQKKHCIQGRWSHPAPNRFYRDIQGKHAAELLMRQGETKSKQMFRNNGQTLRF